MGQSTVQSSPAASVSSSAAPATTATAPAAVATATLQPQIIQLQPTQVVGASAAGSGSAMAPPQPGGIQIVQQIVGPGGELQQIPIQLTQQQMQMIRTQMTGEPSLFTLERISKKNKLYCMYRVYS